jgi:hypothetical protein
MSRTRVFLIAAAIATLTGLSATIAGGILVRSSGGTDCTGPCVTYSEYGWPLQWRTTAPWHYIQATEPEECIGCAIWGYNREGFSFGSFATDTLFFAIPCCRSREWRFRRVVGMASPRVPVALVFGID